MAASFPRGLFPGRLPELTGFRIFWISRSRPARNLGYTLAVQRVNQMPHFQTLVAGYVFVCALWP